MDFTHLDLWALMLVVVLLLGVHVYSKEKGR